MGKSLESLKSRQLCHVNNLFAYLLNSVIPFPLIILNFSIVTWGRSSRLRSTSFSEADPSPLSAMTGQAVGNPTAQPFFENRVSIHHS